MDLPRLMNLDKTNEQFTWWAKEVSTAQKTGIPYALREMCSYGPLGEPGISDTLGAALWALNFFLFAADLDIASVEMHMTENSFASAWQPTTFHDSERRVDLEQRVRPPYYAHIAMAQIIGNGNGTTQIGVLNTNSVTGAYKGYIRAYAAYAQGMLRAVILINSKVAEASTEPKASFQFDLDLGQENAKKTMWLSYLTGPGADSTSDVTFNNMKFDDEDGSMSRTAENDYVTETDDTGLVSIYLRDSEAVVVNIGDLLGSKPVEPKAGDGWKPPPKHKKSGGNRSSSSSAWKASLAAIATTVLTMVQNGRDSLARRRRDRNLEAGMLRMGDEYDSAAWYKGWRLFWLLFLLGFILALATLGFGLYWTGSV
jgi:hypothetical protein